MKTIHPSLHRFLAVLLGIVSILLLPALPANAATYYWDLNGTVAGAGGTPNGTWGGSAVWNTTAAGTTTTPVSTATLAADATLFAAGAEAVSSYFVNVNGLQTNASMVIQSTGGETTFTLRDRPRSPDQSEHHLDHRHECNVSSRTCGGKFYCKPPYGRPDLGSRNP
jgi:hypothetical protein